MSSFSVSTQLLTVLLIYWASKFCPTTHADVSFVQFGTTRTRNPSLAFAGGGFGGGGASKSSRTNKPKKKTKAARTPKPSKKSLSSSEGRMGHIRSRIQAADVSPMARLSLQKRLSDDSMVLDIDPNNICVIDDFLGPEMMRKLRAEAESRMPTMVPSQSTRWDEATQSVVPYEKVGVLSTQIEGGAASYQSSPCLVEYIVTLTAHLTQKLNSILPPTHQLSTDQQTNKLAVCLGDGSHYDKHIDNLGGSDPRKLTALLYLQPPNSHPAKYPESEEDMDDRGGYFRAYDVPEKDQITCIAPRGDRLIMFWSDSLVHDVSSSFCPDGDADQRWALTIWFTVNPETGVIRSTDRETEQVHFGTG